METNCSPNYPMKTTTNIAGVFFVATVVHVNDDEEEAAAAVEVATSAKAKPSPN